MLAGTCHNLNWGEKLHFEQTRSGLAASLALAVLGAWEVRGLLARRPPAQGRPNDTQELHGS